MVLGGLRRNDIAGNLRHEPANDVGQLLREAGNRPSALDVGSHLAQPLAQVHIRGYERIDPVWVFAERFRYRIFHRTNLRAFHSFVNVDADDGVFAENDAVRAFNARYAAGKLL